MVGESGEVAHRLGGRWGAHEARAASDEVLPIPQASKGGDQAKLAKQKELKQPKRTVVGHYTVLYAHQRAGTVVQAKRVVGTHNN